MTKILINTFGTRGDIQPFIALGKGLKTAGYDIAIATAEGFRAFVEENGLNYVHMDNELLRLSQAVLGDTSGSRETFSIIRQISAATRQQMDDEWNAAVTFQPDLIIYHPKCLGSYHVAEKLRIPAIMSIPLPLYTPTRDFPTPFMSGIRLGALFNRFSYRLMGLSSGMFSGAVNDFRAKTLGLPPIGRFADVLTRSDGTPVPMLYPYSSHVLPVPKDFPPHVHVTGYWFLDQSTDWHPPSELVQFLESGTTPVYIGFGSMGASKAQKRAQIVLQALAQSEQRAVLASGWGGLKAADLPPNVFMLESVPHDWLFPQVTAVVHHGGAGTTAAGLHAGKPTIICPFVGDQPFWGRIVHKLGVGPKLIPQYGLTADKLADAMTQAVNDEGMRRRAAELGEKIRTEDGIACAVEIIGTILKH